jgi:thiamine-monophosphate kinase
VELGLRLRGVAHSAIDISDGLLADLGHILERSNVAAEIEFSALPASKIMRGYMDRNVVRAALLAGGDDYELCFTAPRGERRAIERISRRLRTRLSCIGKIVRRRSHTPPLRLLGPGQRPLTLPPSGFDHFR